jgi:hypothetical protein
MSKFDSSLLGLNFMVFESNLVSNSECVSGVVLLQVSVAKRWDNAGTFSASAAASHRKKYLALSRAEKDISF